MIKEVHEQLLTFRGDLIREDTAGAASIGLTLDSNTIVVVVWWLVVGCYCVWLALASLAVKFQLFEPSLMTSFASSRNMWLPS